MEALNGNGRELIAENLSGWQKRLAKAAHRAAEDLRRDDHVVHCVLIGDLDEFAARMDDQAAAGA
jgi:hypothetical protein